MVEELRDLAGQLRDYGVPYGKAYAAYIAGHRSRPPQKPPRLHTELAAAVRDLAKDQAICVGCSGVRSR